MAKINLIRIDSRLIHGQVITKWLKISKANRVLIVDDELAKDDFLSSIYTAAAPRNVVVTILSIEDTLNNMKENQLGKGELLLLTKDVETLFRLFEHDFPITQIQIGGIPSSSDRRTILRAVSLNGGEVKQLTEMNDSGIEITVHTVPEEGQLSFNQIMEKFSKK